MSRIEVAHTTERTSNCAGDQPLDDDRDQLSIAAIQLAGKTDAKIIVLENVPGLCRKEDSSQVVISDTLFRACHEAGFTHIYRAPGETHSLLYVRCWLHGVPQRRTRVLLLASRVAGLVERVARHLQAAEREPTKMVQDVLQPESCEDVQECVCTPEQCQKIHRDIAGYRAACADGERLRKGARILDVAKLAPTITTNLGNVFMVPTWDGGLRRLTMLEVARIQGFPDSFKLPAGRTKAMKILGNAVPPPVGKAIALALRKAMHDCGVI